MYIHVADNWEDIDVVGIEWVDMDDGYSVADSQQEELDTSYFDLVLIIEVDIVDLGDTYLAVVH
jgi:hypothetical protein